MGKHVSNLEGEIFRLRSELNALGDVMRHHVDRAERAEAEADALRKDAERYRWLRENPEHGFGGGAIVQVFNEHQASECLHDSALDAAIDAATKEQG